jgi:F1F0 ATPase subunit 2
MPTSTTIRLHLVNSAWSLPLALGLVVGTALGGAFFLGLRWTVHRGLSSQAPGLWFAASLLVRAGALLVGLYAVGQGDWRRLPACLIGFWIARSIVTRIGREPPRAAVS